MTYDIVIAAAAVTISMIAVWRSRRGLPGPVGPQGLPGPNADDKRLAQIESRLASLEGAVNRLGALPVVLTPAFDAAVGRLGALETAVSVLTGHKLTALQSLAQDAVAFAEQQAASHGKKTGKVLVWSWKDKLEAALDHAEQQAKTVGATFTRQELRLAIEAAVGKSRSS